MKFAEVMKVFLLLIVALALTGIARAELKIISTEHREAESFKRFSEYLSGKENQGRYAIFKSDSNERTGFYVSLEAKTKAELTGVSKIRLQYIRPGTQEIATHEFEVETFRRKRILIGLTEEEWQEPDSRPVAWKIDLIDSNEQTIDSTQSFLWSK